jgi:hypothetical protein
MTMMLGAMGLGQGCEINPVTGESGFKNVICQRSEQEKAHPIRAELKKPEDTIAITSEGQAIVVTIASKGGIGGATLVRLGKSWPATITIRLTLNGLESFGMSNGSIRFNTSLKSPKRMPYWKLGKNEKQPDPPDGTLEVKIIKKDEWFEITVPSEMIQGNPEQVSFGWIDFFRG